MIVRVNGTAYDAPPAQIDGIVQGAFFALGLVFQSSIVLNSFCLRSSVTRR